MNLLKYKKRILNFFTSKKGKKEQKNYLTRLAKNLEFVKVENKTIPFLITAIKDKGFQIKVGGLYGFVSMSPVTKS